MSSNSALCRALHSARYSVYKGRNRTVSKNGGNNVSWTVISKYYKDEKMKIGVFDTWGESEELNDFKQKDRGSCETYTDVFDTLEDAQKFRKSVMNIQK